MKSLFFPGFWGIPGGMPHFGEKSIDTARREVKEEIGVDVKIINPEKRRMYEYLSKNLHSIGIVYHGRIIKGIPKSKDETSEVRWFKPSEIRKMKLAYNHNEILEKEGVI
jgi:8-oxo-dGTP diphosphatase